MNEAVEENQRHKPEELAAIQESRNKVKQLQKTIRELKLKVASNQVLIEGTEEEIEHLVAQQKIAEVLLEEDQALSDDEPQDTEFPKVQDWVNSVEQKEMDTESVAEMKDLQKRLDELRAGPVSKEPKNTPDLATMKVSTASIPTASIPTALNPESTKSGNQIGQAL